MIVVQFSQACRWHLALVLIVHVGFSSIICFLCEGVYKLPDQTLLFLWLCEDLLCFDNVPVFCCCCHGLSYQNVVDFGATLLHPF